MQAGIDEAGRGSLAGPIYAACVVIEKGAVSGLKGSKKLNHAQRKDLYFKIISNCEDFC